MARKQSAAPQRTPDPGARQHGIVKRVIADKGFGFIAGPNGQEYFFHKSAVSDGFDTLAEGAAVTFEPGQGPKGPRAEYVMAV